MSRITALAIILLLTACRQTVPDSPVKGGDELSAFVGQATASATSGFSREGYRLVAEADDGLYWLNRGSGACARTLFAERRLISVVQLPTAACQTVSR